MVPHVARDRITEIDDDLVALAPDATPSDPAWVKWSCPLALGHQRHPGRAGIECTRHLGVGVMIGPILIRRDEAQQRRLGGQLLSREGVDRVVRGDGEADFLRHPERNRDFVRRYGSLARLFGPMLSFILARLRSL